MRIFITGAPGFIGSHVTRALINSGHEVLVLAIPNDNLWRLQDVSTRLNVLSGKLQDLMEIQGKLSKWEPEACIHLAWYAEPGKYLNSKENLISLQGSLDLLQILSECGCTHIIGAGTCAEYEMKSELLSESDKTNPETLYAATKLAFQMIGEKIAAQLGMLFTWGRIFYLYGSHEDPRRLVPSAILKLQKGEVFPASLGEQIRDYLHVTDVANAFLTLLEQQATGIYNICSAKPITIKNLLNTIGDLMDSQELVSHGALPYREWEPMYICGNNKKLTEIGWKPLVDIRSGLNATIHWWEHFQKV